ncbi:plasmid pRiA4b ORF-3 family protein [Desertivirga xinjiangensis]|uniref:plasmid pRiA4b ORF-3 family protein n=1 Tax=Desertivirga xinjiangensis TaxID=539206 RepID=UPI00210AC7DF|nr:plasmid pRiA4b ORF-3 family protein [Pedobacter xinjiangensis]
MAIYRFRVSFEDYDDVIREIDIKSTQTFEDLHIAIHKSTGYNAEKSSSFYVSTDQWIKGDEIAYLPTQRKLDRGVTLMHGTKLNRFIDDPHQKFYYTYNFDRPFDFHVELIKILDLEQGKDYPSLFRSMGEAPKPAGTIVVPVGGGEEPEDFDFLNEMEYAPEDADDLESVDDLGIDAPEEEEEEKDEFMDEFSDNDNFDSEDFGSNNKEDY